MPKKKKDIPDRWENYSNIGDVIQGTQFVAFKVPLKMDLCRKCPQHMWFTPKMLTEYANEKGYDLGLVIDLTFTSRYYEPQELTSHGIEYKKIFVEGHVIPGQGKMDEFSKAVDTFLENPDNKDKLIGVHCTHGVNRTGYMISRYLIEKLDFEAQAAIEAVGGARGHPIERENYLDDLRLRPSSEEDKALAIQDQSQNLSPKHVPVENKERGRDPGRDNWRSGPARDAGQGHGSGNQAGGARARNGFTEWERGRQWSNRDQVNNGYNDYHGGASHRHPRRSDQTNWRDHHGDKGSSGRHYSNYSNRPYPSHGPQRGECSRNWRDSRRQDNVERDWRSSGRDDDYGRFGYHHR